MGDNNYCKQAEASKIYQSIKLVYNNYLIIYL